MSKTTKNYEQLATAAGLRLDETRNILYGQRGGFQMVVYAADTRYPYLFTVCMSVAAPMGMLDKSDIKQFVKGEKGITSLVQDKNQIKMVIKSISNLQKMQENFNDSLNALIAFLNAKGCTPCCQFCGQKAETEGFDVGGSYMLLCPDCVGKFKQDMTIAAQQKEQKSENIIGGIVGALLGSVIGIICIIFFSQLGRISVLSGFVMAICTIKGYEMLGGKLTKKGIVISVIMMLVMTYVGDRLDWAIEIVKEWNDVNFFTAFQAVPYLLAEEVIDIGSYMLNLILLYIFTIVGAAAAVYNVVKDRKLENKIGKIGSTTEL